MVEVVTAIRLAGSALGVLGAILVFLELFQVPSYITYDPNIDAYSIAHAPNNPREYTWVGRIGALAIAVAFAAQFLATFLH